MFKKTIIAGACTLALTSLSNPVLAADYKGPDLKGEVITVTCPWTGAEEAMFKKVVAAFEASTGATVKHSCSQSSEQQIVIDIKAGSPTNISVFPQPGLAANMAAIGGLVPLGAVGDMQHRVRGRSSSLLAGALLGVVLAVQHIGAGEFVVVAAHQAEFDLVLHVFNVEGAAAGARAHQGAHYGVGQRFDDFAHAGRGRALRAVHAQKGFHQRDGDFLRLKRHHRAVAAQDLVVGQGASGAAVQDGVARGGVF